MVVAHGPLPSIASCRLPSMLACNALTALFFLLLRNVVEILFVHSLSMYILK